MEQNWKTKLGYNLALGVAVVTILVSILDIYHDPIFARETLSIKAQVIGQEIINLVIAVPAILYTLNLSKKGSLKARTALIGLLAFLAYTFLSYNILFKLNDGFLLYTLAFALSLYGTLINVSAIRLDKIEIEVPPSTRKWTLVLMGFIVVIILMLWTPDLIGFYSTGNYPEVMVADDVHTLAIHFQDLSIVIPLTILTGWLIWKEEKLGYLLTPILVVKLLSIGLGVLSMIYVMTQYGTPPNMGQVGVFVVATGVLLRYTYGFYKDSKMEYTQ